ncbi:MAG: hypothetical protein ACPHRO_14945, partial [Nannocystaceae bacterium]
MQYRSLLLACSCSAVLFLAACGSSEKNENLMDGNSAGEAEGTDTFESIGSGGESGESGAGEGSGDGDGDGDGDG